MMHPILHTIKYYDIFDMPMTIDELYFLQHISSDNKVMSKDDILKYLQDSNEIDSIDGLNFLKGRQSLVEIRDIKKSNAQKSWKFISRYINDFLKVPFLTAVFASGSLSMRYMSDSSDLDVFIISKNNRIFTVRFFLYLTFKIGKKLWLSEGEESMKFCFNHLITQDSLKMSDTDHIYEARLYSQFFPIIDLDDVFKKFVSENQSSIQKFLPLYPDLIQVWHDNIDFKTIKEHKTSFLEKILSGWIGDVFEWIVKNIQLMVFNKNIGKTKQLREQGFVQMNDKQMRFHTHPVRWKIDKNLHL